MRLSKTREKSILQFLIKHRERYVTSKELAEYLSCSDRTVRNHLKSIDQTLNLQGVSLVSKQGQGYRLFFESQEACQTFRLIYELGDDYNTESSMSQSDDRLAFILNKLLFQLYHIQELHSLQLFLMLDVQEVFLHLDNLHYAPLILLDIFLQLLQVLLMFSHQNVQYFP